MRRLALLAAASLGLGVAVIVDQPAAFARCDQGNCPCIDESFWGDDVDHGKCRANQFCAQKVPEKEKPNYCDYFFITGTNVEKDDKDDRPQ